MASQFLIASIDGVFARTQVTPRNVVSQANVPMTFANAEPARTLAGAYVFSLFVCEADAQESSVTFQQGDALCIGLRCRQSATGAMSFVNFTGQIFFKRVL